MSSSSLVSGDPRSEAAETRGTDDERSGGLEGGDADGDDLSPLECVVRICPLRSSLPDFLRDDDCAGPVSSSLTPDGFCGRGEAMVR